MKRCDGLWKETRRGLAKNPLTEKTSDQAQSVPRKAGLNDAPANAASIPLDSSAPSSASIREDHNRSIANDGGAGARYERSKPRLLLAASIRERLAPPICFRVRQGDGWTFASSLLVGGFLPFPAEGSRWRCRSEGRKVHFIARTNVAPRAR